MDIQKQINELKDWKFEDNSIKKIFILKNFRQAISFMVNVAFYCEELNHHPDWSNTYKKVEIKLSTHDAGKLTEKDIKLAKIIDEIYCAE